MYRKFILVEEVNMNGGIEILANECQLYKFYNGLYTCSAKNMVLKATFDLLVKSKSNNFSLKQHWQNEVSEFR